MSSSILLAYYLNGENAGQAIDPTFKNLTNAVESDALTWIHLDGNHPETKRFIKKQTSCMEPFLSEALLAEETRPRMACLHDTALLILRGVNLNENSSPEDMVSIRLWISKNSIISVRRRRLKAVLDMEEKIKSGLGPTSSGQFIAMLATRLFERMEPTLSNIDETTDNIEENILESTNLSLREEIIEIRKQVIVFRRYMAPQRDAIDQLRMAKLSWLEDSHRHQLQEAYNHVTRYIEDLDAIRERAQIIKDELSNIIADKLNKNMYMLSIIAAIFLPLGFLTGLLGINIAGIPGAANPNAFGIFCGLLSIIVLLQIILFKKMKWF